MRFAIAALLALVVLESAGCRRGVEPPVTVTATTTRASRRAFDGAPPVIPHKPLGAACVTCHTPQGKLVPGMTFAPANPHSTDDSHAGATQNCRQCHLFQRVTDQFAENDFVGLPQQIAKLERAHPLAPPMTPHSELMRENCLACHSGPAARPEIRCAHADRANCKQCHLPIAVGSDTLDLQ